MMKWIPDRQVWSVITLVSFAGLLAACSTYKASLTLRPVQREVAGESAALGSFGEREMAIAQRIVQQIAEEHEMRTEPGPHDASFTEPYRVLTMFCGRGGERNVCLSAAVKDDWSELDFTITDQVHGSETEFTGVLWRRLQEETNEQLPGYAFAEDKSSTLRNPLAP